MSPPFMPGEDRTLPRMMTNFDKGRLNAYEQAISQSELQDTLEIRLEAFDKIGRPIDMYSLWLTKERDLSSFWKLYTEILNQLQPVK